MFIIHIDIDNKKEKKPLRRILTPRHAFPLQLTTNTHTHIIRIRDGNHVRSNQNKTISGLVVDCLGGGNVQSIYSHC